MARAPGKARRYDGFPPGRGRQALPFWSARIAFQHRRRGSVGVQVWGCRFGRSGGVCGGSGCRGCRIVGVPGCRRASSGGGGGSSTEQGSGGGAFAFAGCVAGGAGALACPRVAAPGIPDAKRGSGSATFGPNASTPRGHKGRCHVAWTPADDGAAAGPREWVSGCGCVRSPGGAAGCGGAPGVGVGVWMRAAAGGCGGLRRGPGSGCRGVAAPRPPTVGRRRYPRPPGFLVLPGRRPWTSRLTAPALCRGSFPQ